MDAIFGFLRVHVLAYFIWVVAFFAWKDYLSNPHQRVTVDGLAHTTGPVKYFNGEMSLPSGSRTGYWLMLESPRRDFHVPLGIEYSKTQELSEGKTVTVGYGPEVDPEKATADAFSLKLGAEEILSPDLLVASHNGALDRKLRLAIGTTIGGFAALAVVEILRRKLFPKARRAS